MTVPRELADLPYSSYLVAPDGVPVQGDDYDTVHFENMDFSEVQAGNARFTESAFSSVSFGAGLFRRARFNDVWMHTTQLVGTDLAQSRWLDTEIITSVVAGAAMFDAEMSRVTFFGCKLVSVNLRNAKLREIAFVNCTLRGVDFAGATLTKVSFPGSSVEVVEFDKAKMQDVDLRGATTLSIQNGFDSLKGVTIDHSQLVDLAPAFAQVLGVVVKD